MMVATVIVAVGPSFIAAPVRCSTSRLLVRGRTTVAGNSTATLAGLASNFCCAKPATAAIGRRAFSTFSLRPTTTAPEITNEQYKLQSFDAFVEADCDAASQANTRRLARLKPWVPSVEYGRTYQYRDYDMCLWPLARSSSGARFGASVAAFSNSARLCRAPPSISEPGSLPDTISVDPFKLAEADLQSLFVDIHSELKSRNESLTHIASYYFDGKGKTFRPVITVLMARALNAHLRGSESLLLPSQHKIAMIVEMVHTASLAHDDVIDASMVRRGKPSVNAIWGQRKAVLTGDYVISAAGQLLATLNNVDVILLFSKVLDDLVAGEFMQLESKDTESERFNFYLQKTFKKTASLITMGCQSAAILSGGDERIQEIAYQYGRNIGIAFQLIDDLLDFVSSAATLGKPAAADLKLGLATAPVLFASEKFPELDELINRRFSQPGDCEKALNAVMESNGLAQTRFLAEQHCAEAVNYIQQLAPSPEQKALCSLPERILNRTK